MAACYIVNNVLCFLSNKLRNSPDKLIRSIILDYYDVTTLSQAKYQLKTDIEKLDLPPTTIIPPVPDRREGDHRAVRLLDDILTLIKFLDNNLLLSKLPTYVTDNPDNIPSMRIFEGDLGTIGTMLGKLNERMSHYEMKMSVMCSELSSLSSLQLNLHKLVQSILDRSVCTTPGVCHIQPAPLGRPGAQALQEQAQAQTPVKSVHTAQLPGDHAPATRNSVRGAHITSQTSQASTLSLAPTLSQANVNIGSIHENITSMRTTGWATSSSTPVTQHNMFAPLPSAGSESDEPFTEVVSSRTRRARRRRDSSDNQRATITNSVISTRRPGSRILMGSGSQLHSYSNNITAAKSLRKSKTVLYVDNLSKDCTVDNLLTFVKGLSVDVISCFNVVPRHRRGTNPDKERSAFRLCVAKDDLNRVLDPSVWPDSVTISEWVHKPPTTDDQSKKRSRHNISDTASFGAAITENQSSAYADMDTTVIYNAPSNDTVLVTNDDAGTLGINIDNSIKMYPSPAV